MGPVNVVREDGQQPGLLFAGTENGLYASFDDGAHWQRFQLGLRDALQPCQRLEGKAHVARFVALAAPRLGRDEGRIRLDKQALDGHGASGFMQLRRLREGQVAGKRDVPLRLRQCPGQQATRPGHAACAAPHHAA